MSLLNDSVVTIESTEGIESPQVESSLTTQSTPAWWIDENTPGVGERPNFFPEKYKTVADIVKAHKELEQRLGAAPSQYDFSKGQSWIEPNYEPFHEMAEFAKSKHVPQDVMDKMLETVGTYLDEFKVDIKEEKSKLGENAQERLTKLNNWAKSNLSERSYNALTTGMRTAEAIEALEELRNRMMDNNTMVPGANNSSSNAGVTIEEYRSKLSENFQKYKEDPAFRKEMLSMLEQIHRNK